MQGSPLLTDDAPAQPAAGTVAQPEPLISGDALYLWTGAGAVLFVLVLGLILLGRWRAGRRSHEAAETPVTTDFFQPAGEGAEITFEDEGHAALSYAQEPVAGGEFEPPALEAKPKKSSAFARLFVRKEKEAGAVEAEFPDMDAPSSEYASVRIERAGTPDAGFARAEIAAEAEDARSADDDSLARADEEAQARWRAMEDERQLRLAEMERRRMDEEAAARLTADREQYGFSPEFARTPHDDIVKTLSEVEEALHVQREAIQAETRSLLDSFARRFSERIDALAHSVDRRAASAADSATGRTESSRVLEEIARRLDDHRNEVSDALAALSQRLDHAGGAAAESAALRNELAEIRQSLAGKSAPAAPHIQLSDIISNALAPNGYELDAMLPNNRRADCLVKLARPPGPIAIDARFPVEAFSILHERRGAAAENEFRRTALRHIVDVAERMICPGFTADSAILFLPSESMATELHARFPDVIQDSYRARVWIVSPTTLMATLHTLSAFLRDAPRRDHSLAAEAAAQRALSEVERLSERLGALERSAAAARIDPKPLHSANDESDRRPADAPREEPRRAAWDEFPPGPNDKAGDLYGGDDEAAETRRHSQSRPPFPLR